MYTVSKAKRDAGPQHMSDGKCRHPHRTIGKIRHQHRSSRWVYVDDGIFRHPHVDGLRHAWFFNSDSRSVYYPPTLALGRYVHTPSPWFSPMECVISYVLPVFTYEG
jgi:hypothetical protein